MRCWLLLLCLVLAFCSRGGDDVVATGPQGPQGPPGPQGPQGPQGPPGKDATGGTMGGYQSGARLKVRSWIGDDGSKIFNGIVDTKLNIRCTIMNTADGMNRCIPSWPQPGVALGPYFLDSACKQGIAYTWPCATPPRYAIQYEGSGCDDGNLRLIMIRSMGSPMDSVPSEIYYKATGDVCMNAGNVPMGYKWYLTGDPVPLDGFQAVTEKVE